MPPNKSSQSDGIFGTPIEPLFNNEENGGNPEILQDWLVNMAIKNSQIIQSSDLSQNVFRHGDWVKCLFLMCDRFELPHQAKFSALEIFDRFMTKHIKDLYAHVQNSESKKKKTEWTAILDRVTNQVFLRILSCCQIASKLNSHYKVITIKRARKCLHEAGYSYSNESIIQSEMRVLKTLSYNVSQVSCLDFIEILLECLGYGAGKGVLDLKVYHDTATKILTLVCLHRHQVYDRLHLNISGFYSGVLLSSQEQQNKLSQVMCDMMFLAVAVIAAAVHINNDSITTVVMNQLHKISKVPLEDIQEFCKVILQSLHSFDQDLLRQQLQESEAQRKHHALNGSM